VTQSNVRESLRFYAALLILAAALCMPTGIAAWAQSHEGHNHSAAKKELKEVPVRELMKKGELSEISIGQPEAKITIIEYASMSCGHCGLFHRELLPKLKAKYIDTGIARLIVREFPLNYSAMAVSMLARCAGPDKTYDVIATMFERQSAWLRKGDVRGDVLAIMSEFGVTEDGFKRCLNDKALFHQIKAVRQRAVDAFGVNSTPTFFINGKPLVGPMSAEEFDKIIEPMIQK
jgi:protein-disulfide isomerase